MSDERMNQRVFAWARRNALMGVRNNAFRVIGFLRGQDMHDYSEMNLDFNNIKSVMIQINDKLQSYFMSKWKEGKRT